MWSYCLRGHDYGRDLPIRTTGRMSSGYRKLLAEHRREVLAKRACPVCGEEVISFCQNCPAPIQLNSECGRPAYCFNCAKPFAWTVAANAARLARLAAKNTATPPDNHVKRGSRAQKLFTKARRALPGFLKPTRDAAIDYAAKTTAEIINKSVGS
jgi:hypothetical protein